MVRVFTYEDEGVFLRDRHEHQQSKLSKQYLILNLAGHVFGEH